VLEYDQAVPAGKPGGWLATMATRAWGVQARRRPGRKAYSSCSRVAVRWGTRRCD
jgi:hypothetical protein